MSMHVKKTRQQCLARAIDVLSIFRNTDGRRWTDYRYAFPIDDDGLIFPDGGLLRIKEADMLHRNRMTRVSRQFTCEARIVSVFSREVKGIELIVRTFPALS